MKYPFNLYDFEHGHIRIFNSDYENKLQSIFQ